MLATIHHQCLKQLIINVGNRRTQLLAPVDYNCRQQLIANIENSLSLMLVAGANYTGYSKSLIMAEVSSS